MNEKNEKIFINNLAKLLAECKNNYVLIEQALEESKDFSDENRLLLNKVIYYSNDKKTIVNESRDLEALRIVAFAVGEVSRSKENLKKNKRFNRRVIRKEKVH